MTQALRETEAILEKTRTPEAHQIPFKRRPVEAEILKGFLLTKHIIQGYHARSRCPPNTLFKDIVQG